MLTSVGKNTKSFIVFLRKKGYLKDQIICCDRDTSELYLPRAI